MKIAALLLCLLSAATEPSAMVSTDVSALRALDPATTDLSFARGRFPEGVGTQDDWRTAITWASNHAQRSAAAAARRLADRRLPVARFAPTNCFGEPACDWLLRTDLALNGFVSWADVQNALDAVRPAVAQTLRDTIADDDILAGFRIEQRLRGALANPPQGFTEKEKRIYRLLIGMAVSRTDYHNTAVLAAQIMQSGWPVDADRQVEVAAWFVVVHARHAPNFQMTALDAMRAAVSSARMSPASLATRTDHIWSEMFGFQVFGTKGDCVNGRFVLVATMDPDDLEARRRDVGLPSQDEQERMMTSACAEQANR